MELDQVIKNRRSIRRFKPDAVSDETLNALLEAARLAPSGSNLQPWRFVVIRSPEIKRKLEAVTPYRFALRAPVVLACCADLTAMDTRPQRVGELLELGAFTDVELGNMDSSDYFSREMDAAAIQAYLSLNVAIAVEHIVLKAVDLGLGTCWIGGFNRQKSAEILELDNHIHIVELLPMGYPDQAPGPRPRFPMGKIILKTID